MPPLPRTLALAAALLLLAPAARAVSIVTLQLDPELSVLIPEVGAVQALSGTITLEVGDLPLGSGSTSFDVIDLDVTASGGAAIGLDPAIANPGLGVLTLPGEFLIPTFFLRIDDGTPEDVAIPDVKGSVVFGAGDAPIQLDTSFEIDTGELAGLVQVNVRAVPEPAASALLALGFAAVLALRAGAEVAR